MSTILQTPKIKTARPLNNRNLNLLIVVALIIAIIVFYTSVAGSSTLNPTDDHTAYMLYRQGEWLSVPIPVSNAEAYQIFRIGEMASVPATNTSVVDLTAYYLSERTMVPVLFNTYQLSEWFGK